MVKLTGSRTKGRRGGLGTETQRGKWVTREGEHVEKRKGKSEAGTFAKRVKDLQQQRRKCHWLYLLQLLNKRGGGGGGVGEKR